MRKHEVPSAERGPSNPTEHIEKSEILPVVTDQDFLMIYNDGGQFRGFVRPDPKEKTSKPVYQELLIDKFAYYDPEYGCITRLDVDSVGVDEFGDDEDMKTPAELSGFRTFFLKADRDHGELAVPIYITLEPKDFPNRRVTTDELRVLCIQLHELLRKHARKPMDELARIAFDYLKEQGWSDPENR